MINRTAARQPWLSLSRVTPTLIAVDLTEVNRLNAELGVAATPGAQLVALAAVDAAVREARHTLVAELVLDGWTYGDVGRVLGTSRQAAAKTYGPAVARELRERVRKPAG